VSLPPLEGYESIRSSIRGAFRKGRLPQALLLKGPAGVGKQRLGLWIGQLLLCTGPDETVPCGACQGCRLAGKLQHPDLHWYMPLRKPPTRGSRSRDEEALEAARQDRIEEIRTDPLYPSHSEELLGLHLGTIRNLRRRAASRPSMAPRQVFLVANAEELAAQDGSPEAANALLKLLEEPPADTWLLLTSSEPGRLLPTIRSRTSSIHLPGLPPEQVARFLVQHGEVDEEDAGKAARLSSGSIGRALGFVPVEPDREDGPLESVRKEAFRLLRDALESRPGSRFARALQYGSSGARGLREHFAALEIWIRDLAAASAGHPEEILNQGAMEWLRRTAGDLSLDPARVARAVEHVQEARNQAAGNVNPQLLLFGLLQRLHAEMRGPEGVAGPAEGAAAPSRVRRGGPHPVGVLAGEARP
jgi:DNA polymerase III subunit delta'